MSKKKRVGLIVFEKLFEQLFLAVPQGCLRFVIVVFPDHTHLLFLIAFEKDIFDIYFNNVFNIVFSLYFVDKCFGEH